MRAAKRKYFVLVAVLAFLAIAYPYLMSCVTRSRQNAVLKQTIVSLLSLRCDRLDTAVQGFARDRMKTNGTVTLHELVLGGYLQAKEIEGLMDREVSISLDADEATPERVWIRVRTAGGTDILEMRDGSIQKAARR